MTNAEFRCTSGMRVFFRNGLENYQFVDAPALNSNVLLKLGISISNLQARVAAEKNRQAAFAAERAALAQYEYSLSTNAQIIHIFSTDGLNCETSRGSIVLRGLPGSVYSFLSQVDQLKTDIQTEENFHPTVTTTVYDPNDPDPGFTAETLNQEKVDELTEQKKEKLEDLNLQLDALESNDAERTTVKAYFTGNKYDGMEVWQFVSMGGAVTAP